MGLLLGTAMVLMAGGVADPARAAAPVAAASEAETEAESALCGPDLSQGADAVIAACTEDMAIWPQSDGDYHGYALMNRANAYLKSGRLDQAIADATEAIRRRPNFVEGLGVRGQARGLKGDKVGQMADFDAALKLEPRNAVLLVLRGYALAAQNRTAEALADADAAIAVSRTYGAAHELRTYALLQARRLPEAVDAADLAVALHPEDRRALRLRASLFMAVQRYKEAEADFIAAQAAGPFDIGLELDRASLLIKLQRYADARRVIEPLVASAPDNAYVQVTLGELQAARDETQAATASLKRAFALDPNNREIGQRVAIALWQMGESEEGLAMLDALLARDPDNTTLLGQRILLLQGGDDPRLQADLDRLLRLQPDHPFAHRIRAGIRANAGDEKGAMADVAAATARLDPAGAEELRGRVLMLLKKPETARAAFDASIAARPTADAYVGRARSWPIENKAERFADFSKALALEPRNLEALTARAVLNADYKKDYDQAIADATLAIEIEPLEGDAIWARARAYQEKRAYGSALEDMDRVIAIANENAGLYNGRCWTRALSGRDLDKAMADCERAVRLKPTSAGFQDSLAFVHYRAGRYDQAIAAYDAALKLNPKIAASLYGRGLAKLRKGDTAGGRADIAAAEAIRPEIAAEFAIHDVKP